MGKFRCAVCAGLIVLTAGAASAQQTQTYTYDVHGRLTDSARTTGSSSQTTSYVLDKADNRVSRSTSAPTAGRVAALSPGETIPASESVQRDVQAPVQPAARPERAL